MGQRIALALYGLGLLLLGGPWLLDQGLERWGVRGVAALGLALGLLSLPVARGFGSQQGGSTLALGTPLLLVLAAALESERLLRLVPSWIQVSVGLFFLESLRGGGSLIFRGARWLVPEAPDFVAPYCRKVTACWGLFFLAFAAVSAWLAWADAVEAWRLATGAGLWGALLVGSGFEFLLRKTWFRYYFRGGPFDRLWSRWFPAEATPEGRRSLAAIERYRASLAAAQSPTRTEH